MKAEDSVERMLNLAQEMVEQEGVDAARLKFPDQNLLQMLLLRYRSSHFELIDQVLTSPLPAETKLAAYLNLFDPTQQPGHGRKHFLSFSRDNELAYAANDFTGAMYRFHVDNVDRLSGLLADGIRDGAFAFNGTVQSMAKMMIAVLDEEAKAAARSGDFQPAVEKLLRLSSGVPGVASSRTEL